MTLHGEIGNSPSLIYTKVMYNRCDPIRLAVVMIEHDIVVKNEKSVRLDLSRCNFGVANDSGEAVIAIDIDHIVSGIWLLG